MESNFYQNIDSMSICYESILSIINQYHTEPSISWEQMLPPLNTYLRGFADSLISAYSQSSLSPIDLVDISINRAADGVTETSDFNILHAS